MLVTLKATIKIITHIHIMHLVILMKLRTRNQMRKKFYFAVVFAVYPGVLMRQEAYDL